MLHFVRTNSDSLDFRALVYLLDQYLAELDGAEHAFYAQLNITDFLPTVVVAYQNDQPVGCGAFRQVEPDTVEVKRMYVQPTHRQQGIARAVLGELEKWAAELGYPTAVLETGKRQPEAIALYQRSGYEFTPNYGQYAGVENSVCLRKALVG
jgi:putative acetyltransferase